ncbi:hypothetical protein F383_32327 [Gossypium arboreum]|uniref:Uncharacterized protein n=1 Tax=Gossypium arboreum TaxID=29729 RepID=A0A0B0PMQ1_GOSAR|nr:hypothetical protein F383_32327 [Gossypium arboreum]
MMSSSRINYMVLCYMTNFLNECM